MSKEEPEPVEGEVVTDVIEGDPTEAGDRVIHVYGARGEDDFRLTIPRKSRVTFGYFNPAAPERNRHGGFEGPGANTMRTTALRIYEGGEKTPQLACFLGVAGFRDTAIAITRLKKRVVVERQYADDGEGEEVWSGKQQRTLAPHNEDDDFAF